MEMKEKYPMLRSLLCAHFNQDWDLDYDSPEVAIKAYAQVGGKAIIMKIIFELKALLKEDHTLEEWDIVLYDGFECSYYFDYEEDYTPKEWLEKVLKQFEEELLLAKDD